ncbi:hypothetical protein D3C84_891320 [compost metagenome]
MFVDQVFGAQAAGGGDDQKVRRTRQLGGRRAETVGHVAAMLAVVVAHRHVEAVRRAFRNGHADRAEAKDAQAFAREGRAHDFWPFAAANGGVAAGNVAHQCQEHGHGVVGHR